MLKPFTLLAASIALTSIAPVAFAASEKIQKIMDPDMLGVDLAYFEQVTGIARKTDGTRKQYKVDGCEVTIEAGGGTVNGIRVPVTPQCAFDLNKFLPNADPKFGTTGELTFGQFDKSAGDNGEFLADCLSMCGNAADPSVYEFWEGSHADNFLNVTLEVVLVDDAAIAAASQWQAAMTAGKGEDWVMDTKFNCEPATFDAAAHKAFAAVKVSAISIGQAPAKPGC